MSILSPGLPSRRPRGSRLLAVLLTVLLLAVAALGVRRLLAGSPTSTRRPVCVSASPTPTLAPSQVHLRVLNATSRRGLARQVATELTARGFVVDQVANAASPQAAAATVLSGASGQQASAMLAAQVLDATVAPAPPTAAAGSVDLVLGAAYARLRSPAEVAALAAAAAAAKPTPGPGCT